VRAESVRTEVEFRVRARDGGWRWVHAISTSAERDETGRVIALAGFLFDIDERKKAEAALRRSNKELQRFAYVASHDLQEPLRSIVSFSQLLERRYKGKLGQDADDYIGFIVESGNRMQTLIRDLLEVSRVETQAKPLEPTDAAVVAADAVRSLETSLREAGATVTVGDLPVVLADAAQLEQVFTNLIGNAIKYRRDGVQPEIEVFAYRAGPMVEFAVKDNGIGIEAEYFERIFEMFRRLHTHDEYEGTGIGLALVKKIVDRHGGTVRVASTPGEGSTFFFALPAA
ncbi:MAG: ATP-binding protein, partial [Methanospirillum sp.]